MSRIPNVLVAAGTALLGWTVAPLLGLDDWRPLGAIAGIAVLVAGLALSTRRVRVRLGWLPARSRLSGMWNQVADLRGKLREAYGLGKIARTDWDWRISTLETRLWGELRSVLPDDWRAMQRAHDTFAHVNAGSYVNDSRWAYAMLGLLNDRMKMLREEMDRLRA